MSATTADLKEAEHIPGAFPSEDAVTDRSEQPIQSSHGPSSSVAGTGTTGDENLAAKAREFAQQQHEAHTAGRETGSTSRPELSDQDDKAREFHAQQHAAHTAGGQGADKYTPGSQQDGSRVGAGASSGQNSAAWTDLSNPEDILRNANTRAAPTSGSSLGITSGARQQTSSSPDAGVDLSSVGGSLAETATAITLAAKDALLAAKNAAAPAVSAATEQAKNLAGYANENAVPAANYAAEQTQNAAAYAKDAAASAVSGTSQQVGSVASTDTVSTGGVLDTANSAANYAKNTAYIVANTAQSSAPNVLGAPTGTASSGALGVEASGEKSQVESELPGQSHSRSLESTKAPQSVTSRTKGLSLEEQLMPDSLTPGVAKILGTEHDRSFPLGAIDEKSS